MGLWLLDRPGSRYRWKTASLAAMMAAGVGLLVAQVITHFWQRPRPYVAHPHETILLVPPSSEPSFPSDHAVAAFAIAFTVAFVGRGLGALFLAAASVVSLSRVAAGLHYPGDVLGGAAIGFLSAALVLAVAGDRFPPIIAAISRVTDPVAARGWRALDRARDRRQRQPIS